ncbi:GNAT family N-acetyltransferase [Stieleria varia]|uniref:N-acetyltransferase domain-containing protein n=1 Tax=Stieleria varia TaxID=2528005 RepID=A0A5C6B052_9BACT|nr:GNAT family N-acetyltransferase [Stieleria varia]TWU04951.1 hypothetical protein Pla52n_29960 [Stieleria varia]
MNEKQRIRIREATAKDISFLAASICRLQAAHVEAYPHIYRPIIVEEAVDHVSDLLNTTDYFLRIAETSQMLVGSVICEIRELPQSFFTLSHRLLHLMQIEVHPDCRNMGVGSALSQLRTGVVSISRNAIASGFPDGTVS